MKLGQSNETSKGKFCEQSASSNQQKGVSKEYRKQSGTWLIKKMNATIHCEID